MNNLRRVALAYDGSLESRPGIGAAHDAIHGTVAEIRAILEKRGYDVVPLPVADPVWSLARRVKKIAPDVVFNLVEGLEGSSAAEGEVARELERSGVPFTGCPSDAIDLGLDKEHTKEVLRSWGLPVPRGMIMEGPRGAGDLRYPLIVKCLREDASLGLDDDSVVRDEAQLRSRVEKIVRDYGQPAMVEEFLEGREFNVAVVGPKPAVLPVSEIDFSAMPAGKPKFVSYAAKWFPDSVEFRATVPVCPAPLDPVAAARLRRLALRTFRLVGCRDCARVDFRTDSRGRPRILEVNPNPDLAADAGLARSVRANGWSYDDFIERLALWALERNENAGNPFAAKPATL